MLRSATAWHVLLALGLIAFITTPALAALGDQLFKVTASDSFEEDQFGVSVAISGTTAIVGAVGTAEFYPWKRDRAHYFPGAAYVIDVSTGQELRQLTAADGSARDEFGHSVAISGNLAIVGSPLDDDTGSNSGSAYLFDVATGTQLFKLMASDATANQYFGSAVAISGNIAAVRAAGAGAYLFDVSSGRELTKLTVGGSNFHATSHDVAVSDDFVLVGAMKDEHAGPLSGAAFLFDVKTGAQLMKLTASDGGPYSLFGSSVSIDGNRALVGAYGEGVPGAAYLFDLTTGEELMKISSPAGDDPYYRFGSTVILRNNMALSGAPDDGEELPSSGAAYVFDITTGEQLHKFEAADGRRYDHLGYTVAMDGHYMVTGVTPDRGDGTPGSIYVFALVPEPSCALLIGIAGIWFTVFFRPQVKQ